MIKIYNRKTKAYDVEQVAGLKYINWSYASPIGKSFLELFIKKKMFSKLYGNFCDSSSQRIVFLNSTKLFWLLAKTVSFY